MPGEDWRVLRARIAAMRRHYPDNPDLVTIDRHTLKLRRAKAYIRRLVSEPPELSDEERAHLADLLLGGVDAAD